MISVTSAGINPSVTSAGINPSVTSAVNTYGFSASHTTIPSGPTFSIKSIAVMMMSVSASVVVIYSGTIVIEYVPVIMSVDGEHPATMAPYDRSYEVVSTQEQVELPVEQDVPEIRQTIVQILGIEVTFCLHTQEVVEIDLIRVIILLIIQVQFISHLVSQVECLFACPLITHC